MLTLVARCSALGILAAWWRRLGEEPGGAGHRIVALLLLAIGALIALKPQYLAAHEVWAGLLLALGGGLHRPGKWRAAWLPVGAGAGDSRTALPFVLLLARLRRVAPRLARARGMAGAVALFALGLGLHLHEVGKYLLPSDRPSPPWLVFRGLGGWTGNIVEFERARTCCRIGSPRRWRCCRWSAGLRGKAPPGAFLRCCLPAMACCS